MHDEIKRFSLTGTIGDGNLMQTRERLIYEVECGMRDEGFVPMLELQPHFTRVYDAQTETYSFEVSVYGTYIGEQAWDLLGMEVGTLTKRSTPRAKLRQSSAR